MGAVQFGAPRAMVLWLKDEFKIKWFVETGTNKAGTAVWAADHFENVVTIEGSAELYAANVAAHGDRKNIEFLLGDTRTRLAETLARLKEPAILWLDAHWCGSETFGHSAECPLLDELATVNRFAMDHIVLIDDARLFIAPPPIEHQVDHWPHLMQVTAALGAWRQPRHALIHEDVIVGVSKERFAPIVEYVRKAMAPPPPEPVPQPEHQPYAPPHRNPVRRLLGRVKRKLMGQQ
jgi:hypothetical protein